MSEKKYIEVKSVARSCDDCPIAITAMRLGWVCPACVGLVEDRDGKKWIYQRPLFPDGDGYAKVLRSQVSEPPPLLLIE